jgi:2C-methyl-D-erythritol 2,4-cyclodiphosphate synthase
LSGARVGIGFDQHRFASGSERGRALVLGGVSFEAEPALQGHSDADVVAHAVADAMLGAAALGDLGAHFRLANADCTVICETPRIGDARGIMMERLSAAAAGPVHVKATRPEGMGSLGRVEGIACLATALLEEIG